MTHNLFISKKVPLCPTNENSDFLKMSGKTRDIYKAMVLDMDDAVKDIVKSLKKNDLYNDTVIVFTTDNGGAISHGASNWPLRGTKGTMFEGGTKAVR